LILQPLIRHAGLCGKSPGKPPRAFPAHSRRDCGVKRCAEPFKVTNLCPAIAPSLPVAHAQASSQPGKWGHPLEGGSREKTPLLSKKSPFFAWLLVPHSTVLFYNLFSHPLFLSYRFTDGICRSAPVTHRDQGDCVLGETFVL